MNSSFDPFIRQRNVAPARTFNTKWEPEIAGKKQRKCSFKRERLNKFHDFDNSYFEPVYNETVLIRRFNSFIIIIYKIKTAIGIANILIIAASNTYVSIFLDRIIHI